VTAHESQLDDGGSHLHMVPDPVPDDALDDELEPDETSTGGSAPRRRWPRLLIALVAVLGLLTAGAAATHRWPFAGGRGDSMLMIGALPYWNIGADSAKILANKGNFTEVTPWMYGIDDNGGMVSLLPPSDAARTEESLNELRQAGIKLVPTISNTQNGAWDYPTIIQILRDPARRAQHIANIVGLSKQNNYAGIDIDYENFQAQDRAVFTAFIAELAKALHRADKTLSVDLFAKSSDRGYDQRNQAQDYRAIGRAADAVRLMAYDWHWNSSEPGPIAPIKWVRSVLDYALTQIPPHKIILGVPAYGYDWVGKKGRLVSWLQAYGLEQKYGAAVHWDATSQSPWLTYRSSDGQRHVVWFENSYSMLAKLGLAHSAHIGGAYLWLAGDEDDLLWKRLDPKDIDQAARSMNSGPQDVTPS
jgi:spore germination protein YaaH